MVFSLYLGRVRRSDFMVEGNMFMNVKLQQAGDRGKATWLDPFRCYWIPPPTPPTQKQVKKQANRKEKQQNIQRRRRRIIASEDGSSQLHHSLALVTEPTLWVIQNLYCILYIQYMRPFFKPLLQSTTPPPTRTSCPGVCARTVVRVFVPMCVSKIKHLLK